MASIPKSDVNSLVKLVQSNLLLNRQLQTICQINGLRSAGVKAEMQGRIVNRMCLPPHLALLQSSVRVG
jgi:E3 SUMO-protein ligase PIAS1